jgi:16S rRNA (guanine527-N7)-methyltransferase
MFLLVALLVVVTGLQRIEQGHAFQSIIDTTSTTAGRSSKSGQGTQQQQRQHSRLQSTTSANFAMAPDSLEARQILQQQLGLDDETCHKLAELAVKVVAWNDRINLVSRKDCTVPVVFGRHVLPCLAPLSPTLGVFCPTTTTNEKSKTTTTTPKRKLRIVDVGTGGGFPGLPLAICNPHCDFVLVDSVGKKLTAVQEMAQELGLTNVQTHHGRAEEMWQDHGTFDVCVGRSVAALPKYCLWMHSLLKAEEGSSSSSKLVYLIGGEMEPEIWKQAEYKVAIDQVLQYPGVSDKNILVFDRASVVRIAALTGESLVVKSAPPVVRQKKPLPSRAPFTTTIIATPRDTSSRGSQERRAGTSNPRRTGNTTTTNSKRDDDKKKPMSSQAGGGQTAKGQWKKRGDSDGEDSKTIPKQRGYENFQRFDSSSS